MIGPEKLKFIRSLIQTMEEGEIDNMEVQMGVFAVSLSTKTKTNGAVDKQQHAHLTLPAKDTPVAENPIPREVIGLAPCIGIFQSSPAPDAEPYIQVGQEVKAGQVVIGIFALQLIHEFTIARDGVIKEILVNHGDSVEFAKPLLVLELSPDAEPLKKDEVLIPRINNQ